MNISAITSSAHYPSGQTNIDKQIQMLNKRKADIFNKIVDVINGDDEQEVKDEKIKALRMEISLIDLQIQQLMQKKIEQEKQKSSPVDEKTNPLPPSPSDLIQPDKQQQKSNIFLDIRI